jgi:hypothetical protein
MTLLRTLVLLAVLCLTTAPLASRAAAQQVDSARAGAAARRGAGRDTTPLLRRELRVSPRKAALRSFLVPGWGQTTLDRGTAGGLFALMEATSVSMIIKSKRSLDRAKRARADSIFQGWELDAEGKTVLEEDPETGELRPVPIYEPNWLVARIPSRREQLEDWIALLVFNHLFSAADAFVAAHLSDVPRRTTIRRMPEGGWMVGARLAW